MIFNASVPVHCSVCGAPLNPGIISVCEHCGSEHNFENPSSGVTVVKRGSTPAGRRVAELLVARFMESRKVNLSDDTMAMQRITEASERAAREVLEKGKTMVEIPFIAAGPSGPVHLKIKLKKEDLG